jgi:hypothetical protein
MHPQFPGEAAINPFDLWEGANFKLKIRNVEGYRNYDKSEFDKAAPLLSDDDALEALWKTEYSLQELVDPKHFKSYDELKARLEKALGNATISQTRSVVAEEEEAFPTPQRASMAKELPKAEAQGNPWDENDDEDLSFFKKLANKD